MRDARKIYSKTRQCAKFMNTLNLHLAVIHIGKRWCSLERAAGRDQLLSQEMAAAKAHALNSFDG